eukprot:1541284-Alexandrium_andersonii.AAC.1
MACSFSGASFASCFNNASKRASPILQQTAAVQFRARQACGGQPARAAAATDSATDQMESSR